MGSDKATSVGVFAVPGRVTSKKVFISSEITVAAVVIALLAYYHFVFNGSINYWVVVIAVIGVGLSLMDSSMGMGYGTVGSPLLIILGFSSKVVVPAILISQVVAALVASAHHQRLKNVNYFNLKGKDVRVEILLIVFGLVGATAGVFLSLHLSKEALNLYIGGLVIAMSSLLLIRPAIAFSWLKVTALSLVSAFNKAISGGGYGPVATTGLLVSGNPLKNTVAATIFSVIFINLYSFIVYLSTKSFSAFELSIFLTIGVLIGSQIGPGITKKASSNRARTVFACIAMIMGSMTIILTFAK